MENKTNLSSSEGQSATMDTNAELVINTIPFELFDLAEATDEKASILADFLDKNAKQVLEEAPLALFELANKGDIASSILQNFLNKNAKLVLEIAPDELFDLVNKGDKGEQILTDFLRENAALALEIAPQDLFDLEDVGEARATKLAEFLDKNAELALKIAPVYLFCLANAFYIANVGDIGAKILAEFLDKNAELALKIAPEYLFYLANAGDIGEKILAEFLGKNAKLVLEKAPEYLFDLANKGDKGETILAEFLKTNAQLISTINNYEINQMLSDSLIVKHNIKLFDFKLKAPEGVDPVIKSLISKMHIRSNVTTEEKDILTSNLVQILAEAIQTPAVMTLFKSASHIEKPINLYREKSFNEPGLRGNASYKYGVKMFDCESLLKPLHKNTECDTQMVARMSTLLHECTHMVLRVIYDNDYKPFSKEGIDDISQELFSEILESLSKKATPYSHYPPKDHIVELPAFLSSAIMMDGLKGFSPIGLDQKYKLLLEHENLQQYIRKVYETVDFDSTAIEAVTEIFAEQPKTDQALKTPLQTPGFGNEDPAAIIMGYLRGGYEHDFNALEPAHTEAECGALGGATEPHEV